MSDVVDLVREKAECAWQVKYRKVWEIYGSKSGRAMKMLCRALRKAGIVATLPSR